MLLELAIRNIALIDSLNISFDKGLSVLTGETGAGKSIIVDSVALALGARVDKELIRYGKESASVSAVFDIEDCTDVKSVLDQFGIPYEDNTVILVRELSLNGRNLCRISGMPATLAQLRMVASHLMDMHGQHEHQRLLDPSSHLGFIDNFGDVSHKLLMEEVRAAYNEYRDAKRELISIKKDAADKERLYDMLRFQVDEINAVKPKTGELEKLEARAKIYENASLISDKVASAYGYVYAGSGRSLSAQDALKRASEAMDAISKYDKRFEQAAQRLQSTYYEVQDIGLELRDMNENTDFDPEKQARIEDRIEALKKLLRKYGPEIENVIAFRDDAEKRLESLDTFDDRFRELEKKAAEAEEKYSGLASALTESRRRISERFCEEVRIHLSDLGMRKIRFEAVFTLLDGDRRNENGQDDVELFVSFNPGEPLKPMAAIASGGELARIMLAFKTVESAVDNVGTMVFDEIDTGVSGHIAQTVGEKMCSIAKHRQVICVTHLPQIAALGDNQYLVEKNERAGRTMTNVRRLDREGRIAEISRLVGGADGGESAAGHAERMLELAAERKNDL